MNVMMDTKEKYVMNVVMVIMIVVMLLAQVGQIWWIFYISFFYDLSGAGDYYFLLFSIYYYFLSIYYFLYGKFMIFLGLQPVESNTCNEV